MTNERERIATLEMSNPRQQFSHAYGPCLVVMVAVAFVAACGGKTGSPGTAGSGGAAVVGGTSGGQGGGPAGTGGGAGGAGGSGASCSSWAPGTVTWEANGVKKCAVNGFATRVIGPGNNELLIVAIGANQTDGYVIDVDTNTEAPPHGTYVCQKDGGVMPYIYGGIPPVTLSGPDCTITIDEAGTSGTVNARGTFSGTYTLLDDSTLEIRNGVFDVKVGMGL